MDLLSHLEERPIVVCVAGPNGAGKSTFYEAFLEDAGLRYVNADDLARELGLDAYTAADVADRLRTAIFGRSALLFVMHCVRSLTWQESMSVSNASWPRSIGMIGRLIRTRNGRSSPMRFGAVEYRKQARAAAD